MGIGGGLNPQRLGRRPNRSCGECAHPWDGPPIGHAEETIGSLIICHRCAAISLWDGSKYRGLRTQEWLDLSLESRWYDLLEERGRILERLTAPPPGIIAGGRA